MIPCKGVIMKWWVGAIGYPPILLVSTRSLDVLSLSEVLGGGQALGAEGVRNITVSEREKWHGPTICVGAPRLKLTSWPSRIYTVNSTRKINATNTSKRCFDMIIAFYYVYYAIETSLQFIELHNECFGVGHVAYSAPSLYLRQWWLMVGFSRTNWDAFSIDIQT